MKHSKFLLISSVCALVLAITILPVVAKPVIHFQPIAVQQHKPDQAMIDMGLRSALYHQVNVHNPLATTNHLSTMFNHSFSTTLILNSQPTFEENNISIMNYSYSKRKTFFETTMLFNDKLQQFLALFSSEKNNTKSVNSAKNSEDQNCQYSK